MLDAVRAYSATADLDGRGSRKQQIREADEAIERANVDLDDTIRQLGELGLLGRPASQETLQKLTAALDDAHTARARLGDPGESNIIGPDEIDKLCEPAKRLAAWRRLITDTVESVTVAPAMTADGRPSRRWDPDRIDIRFLRPASVRKPPGATSRAPSAPSGSTTRTTLPTVVESDVVARHDGRNREATERDRRHQCGEIRPHRSELGADARGWFAGRTTVRCACRSLRIALPASTGRVLQSPQTEPAGRSRPRTRRSSTPTDSRLGDKRGSGRGSGRALLLRERVHPSCTGRNVGASTCCRGGPSTSARTA